MKKFSTFKSLFSVIVSFIYPESAAATQLRALSPEEVWGRVPRVVDFSGLIDRDIHAVWQYQHELAEIVVLEIKGSRNLHAAKCAGFAVYKYLQSLKIPTLTKSSPLIQQQILLIPIPLSRKRQNERGYNQCELIVKAILETAQAEMNQDGNVCAPKLQFEIGSNILIRQKHSAEQKTKNRSERIKSSENIFTLKDSASVAGRTCIVIDDVVTTGSTLVAAQKVLNEAGAVQVELIAVAH